LLASIVVTTIIFGFQLKIFEGPLSEVTGEDYTSIVNCCWNVVITLTSVGYGDFSPKSFFGRIVGTLICFWGMIIISLIVVKVQE